MTVTDDPRCDVCGLRSFVGDPVLRVSDGVKWGSVHRACMDQWGESGERCDPSNMKRAAYGGER